MAASSRINWTNALTVGGAVILVGAEVFGVVFAAAWALSGMLELGPTFKWTMMAVFGAAGLWIMTMFTRKALSVEPVVDGGRPRAG